ncbi:SITS-binding protein-like [Apteryx rowi]|uniref:SITS-binding protein-like n=1 Tax=Apteryx rowi TaxID=308060 RepID=UPI000E1D2A1B|nr:SITS-binding protein-like [Apteryx rowi]
MANVSWYGGGGVRAPRWLLNAVDAEPQPFVISDFGRNPGGYGPVLEGYFLGSTGSAAKIKRGLRAFSNRLQRHRLKDGLLALGERCTAALADVDGWSAPAERRRRRRRGAKEPWDLSAIEPMKLSITLSPYAGVASPLFLRSLGDGAAASRWLSLRLRPEGSVPLLSPWKGQLAARLDATSEAAVSWFVARAGRLRQALGAEHAALEGAEGNAYLERGLQPPGRLRGDGYAEALAAVAARLGNGTVVTAGARSSHLPLFVRMSPLRADWSHGGLKGLVPAALHYSLLGYSFFVPDAVGGTLADEAPADQELYVRWLQIVTFLPVMSFSTPPWACCDAWVLNLTRQCIQRHQDFVAPLIAKYSQDWVEWGYPIFRPVWWLSPMDPAAFTIEDEFLIGDEVLVAPITEKGQTWRDIYLPGEGCLWMDTNTAQVFDGGTVLRNYSASLAEVPVFVKAS